LVREKRIVDYLCRLPAVTVDVVAVDYLDSHKTKELFHCLPHPVAGVFFLPVKLNNQLFINLRMNEDWNSVHGVKVKGLRVWLDIINPESLDFLLLASYMAAVAGSPGQANYAAAQTLMERIGAELPNTISIAVPPIVGASCVTS
ncbi:hypothetical protein POSPLADRAFT_1159342, partial [Postia placenta MAD-698-R-SB12]